MPKVTGLFQTAEKLEEMQRKASGNILKYMTLSGVTDEALAKRMNVHPRTIQNRIKNPGSITLRDLWQMSLIIKCPVGELAGGADPAEVIGKCLFDEMQRRK